MRIIEHELMLNLASLVLPCSLNKLMESVCEEVKNRLRYYQFAGHNFIVKRESPHIHRKDCLYSLILRSSQKCRHCAHRVTTYRKLCEIKILHAARFEPCFLLERKILDVVYKVSYFLYSLGLLFGLPFFIVEFLAVVICL